MAIFNSYVKLPEGIHRIWSFFSRFHRFWLKLSEKLSGRRKERLASSIRLAPSVGFSEQIWQFLGCGTDFAYQGWPRRRNLVKRPRGRQGRFVGRRYHVIRIDLMICDGSNILMANVVRSYSMWKPWVRIKDHQTTGWSLYQSAIFP